MQTTNFSRVAPRPRKPQSFPAYPALCAVTLALSSALSCASPGAQTTASAPQAQSIEEASPSLPTAQAAPLPTPTTLVIPAPQMPPAQPVASVQTAEDPPAETRQPSGPPTFPEDKEALPMVGCGGGCPPAFQLGADAKDRDQVRARILYCVNTSQPRVLAVGTLFVQVEINGRGSATKSSFRSVLTGGAVPDRLTNCISGLIRTAHFHAESNYSRKHEIEYELKFPNQNLPTRNLP